MGQTVHIAVADGGMADILAVEQDLAAVLFQQADDHADELALAVAFDTGHAEDLSLVDGERDLIQNILVRVALRLERYIFKRQDSIACMLGAFSRWKSILRPTIISERSSTLAVETSQVPMHLPRRRTVQ